MTIRMSGHLLVPSSETMPRPSALFCLSKALRSRTLQREGKHSFRWMFFPVNVTFLSGRLTCRSASVPEHLKRNLHPSYPSGIPAFSKKEGRKKIHSIEKSNIAEFEKKKNPEHVHAEPRCCHHWGWRYPTWGWLSPSDQSRLILCGKANEIQTLRAKK